jgi:thiosulfate reductase cytochrome b subunit
MLRLSWVRFASSPDSTSAAVVCYAARVSAAGSPANPGTPRHSALVRVTHWITVVTFFALLITGAEIVISHPRFYWGEVGNVMTRPLFTLPIPSSRGAVPTAYGFVMPDQNGWSRYLHFEAAWALVLTGLVYGISSLRTGHFRKDLLMARADRTWQAFSAVIGGYLRREPQDVAEAHSYNVVQRSAYLVVIFILFPLVIWTGLAMSPAFNSAVPVAVNALGGRQSARTLHFFVSGALLLFVVVHVVMVFLSGFRTRMRAMITGRVAAPEERP